MSVILTGPEQSPFSGGKPQQLIIFLHGLGANGEDLIGLADVFGAILPEAHFLSPNAPFPCDMAPFGYQWFSLMDWSEEKILEGIRVATPLLNAFVDEQLQRFNLTADKLAFVGFSQGTMMSLHVNLRRPKACAGVLGYSGALMGEGLLAGEIQSRPPVCLVHGTFDNVVPFAAMGKAETALNKVGVPVETHARPGIAHGIDPMGLEIGKKFLTHCLLDNKSQQAVG